jgi:hypothetical protein
MSPQQRSRREHAEIADDAGGAVGAAVQRRRQGLPFDSGAERSGSAHVAATDRVPPDAATVVGMATI